MYALADPNIHNLAVEGVFDDCQDIIKAIGTDAAFKTRYAIGTVNSINWARVAAQIVYYFKGYFAVATSDGAPVDFAVPSGNFGNILAGHVARQMGLPIRRLILATNENDVLDEFFRTGRYRPRSTGETHATSSPSMDISKASNFERYVFDIVGRDTKVLRELWTMLAREGGFDLSTTPFWPQVGASGFVSGVSTHHDRIATIRETYARSRVIIDPHTADGLKVGRACRDSAVPLVCIETALPAEFLAAGLLLFCSALLALLFRQHALALAIPLLALAAYPVVQIVHALASVATSFADTSALVGAAFDVVLLVWTFLLFVRVVAVALLPANPHRWPRALVGGLLLVAPILLAPMVMPSEAWWRGTTAAADSRYPNAASEPVLAAQQSLLDDALSNLEDERSGETDLYFIGFAGDAREGPWRNDVEAAQHAMDERWDTRGRSITLLNSPQTLLQTPMATVTNLRETLKEVAAAIEGALAVTMAPLALAPIAPSVLRTLLDESGIQWRIVIVAACHAGEFVQALQSETTLVLTATGDGATYGCERSGEVTNLGAALFGDALPRADSLRAAIEAAHTRIVAGERNGRTPSAGGAQLVIGPAMAEKLKELDQTRATRRSNRSV